jgi:phosphatidate cytidylyltransferase
VREPVQAEPDSARVEEPLTPTGAPARRRRSDLPARLVTASILVPFVLFAIAKGGLWVLGTVVGVVVLTQRELYGLIQDKGARPVVGFGLAAGAALPVVAYIGNEYHATVLMTFTLLAVMIAQLRRRQVTEAMASISGTFFGVFYVGWLLSHAIPLRFFTQRIVADEGEAVAVRLGLVPESGAFLLVYCLTVVVLCDAGAYFAGHAYGRRKLAPGISPSKTVEGAIGGLLLGTFGGGAMKLLFDLLWPGVSTALGWPLVFAFGPLIAAAGIVGDLVESLLKRDAQVKDTGALLPGMGGFLDRLDSILLGVPVMYYLLLFYVWLQVRAP